MLKKFNIFKGKMKAEDELLYQLKNYKKEYEGAIYRTHSTANLLDLEYINVFLKRK